MNWLRRLLKPLIIQRLYQLPGAATPLTEAGVQAELLGASKTQAWMLLKHKLTRQLITDLTQLPDGKTKPGDVGMELGNARGLARAINLMSMAEIPPKTKEEIAKEEEDLLT